MFQRKMDELAATGFDDAAPVARPAPASSKFRIDKLSALAYGGSFTLWVYQTSDLAAAETPDFFGPAAQFLTVGDVLFLVCDAVARARVVASLEVGNVLLSALS